MGARDEELARWIVDHMCAAAARRGADSDVLRLQAITLNR
jgi:hypothetical protein